MRRLLRLLPTLTYLSLSACLAGTDNNPPASAPQGQIVDATHGAGDPHFFFLPPLTSETNPNGVFNPRFLLDLRVEICEWAGASCAIPLIAVFSATAGGESETIRLDLESESYHLNWQSKDYALDPAKTYRIRVMVRNVELGHADVEVVGEAGELLKNGTTEFIPLNSGRTLPIKFRIEDGVRGAAVIGPEGGSVVSQDTRVKLVLDAGSVSSDVTFTIAPVPMPASGPVLIGSAYDIGPGGFALLKPATLEISYGDHVADVPSDDDFGESLLRLYSTKSGSWRLVEGSTVDVTRKIVSGRIDEFRDEAIGTPLCRIDPAAAANVFEQPAPVNWLAERTNEFGEINPAKQGKLHLGHDMRFGVGTEVFAAANGVVKRAGTSQGYGHVLIIEHALPDGRLVTTLYGHLASKDLASCGAISRGERVGQVATQAENGSTPGEPVPVHFHFGARNAAYSDQSLPGYLTPMLFRNLWCNPLLFIRSNGRDCSETLIVAGGTLRDRDLGFLGTSFVFVPRPYAPEGTPYTAVPVRGPSGWNDNAPFACGSYLPAGPASNRSPCWNYTIVPITGDYTGTVPGIADPIQTRFSFDARVTLEPPDITSVRFPASGQLRLDWVSTPEQKSCLVRVNEVPWPGFPLAEFVVPCSNGSFLFAALPFVAGRRYQAVVFAFSQDITGPDPVTRPFNVSSDDVVFFAPLITTSSVAEIASARVATTLDASVRYPPSPPVDPE